MAKECVTHHYACDCREQKFMELEEENQRLKSALDADIVSEEGFVPVEYTDD